MEVGMQFDGLGYSVARRQIKVKLYLRIRPVGVEAFTVEARAVAALYDVIVAGRTLESWSTLALIAVLEGLAGGAILTRVRGAVVFQLAMPPYNRKKQVCHEKSSKQKQQTQLY